MLYEHRFEHLGRRFLADGLSPVVVKGQAVVDLAFPRNEVRLASDVDLLVGNDESDVCASLIRNGYFEKEFPERRFSSRLLGERPFFTKDSQLPPLVEVHRFLDKAILRPVDYASILARAKPSARPGFSYPQAEDLFLLLVLHESVSLIPSIARTQRDLDMLSSNAAVDMKVIRMWAADWELSKALEALLTKDGAKEDAAPNRGLPYIMDQRRKHDRLSTWLRGMIKYAGLRMADRVPRAITFGR